MSLYSKNIPFQDPAHWDAICKQATTPALEPSAPAAPRASFTVGRRVESGIETVKLETGAMGNGVLRL